MLQQPSDTSASCWATRQRAAKRIERREELAAAPSYDLGTADPLGRERHDLPAREQPKRWQLAEDIQKLREDR